MSGTLVFTPIVGGSVRIDATTATNPTALPGGARLGNDETFRFYNAGPSDVFVEPGTSSGVTAVADGTDLCIPAGNTEVFRLPSQFTHVATITASGTAALFVTRGTGA